MSNEHEMIYRNAPVSMASGAPASLDIEGRSVEAVGATEEPIMEYSRRTWELMPTIILMSGCQLPASRQLPLLDTHSRWSTSSVLGSYRDMRVDGAQLVGRATFSAAKEADGAWLRTMEGHLTDYSVGRVDHEVVEIQEGATQVVAGRSFTGPMRVVTKWTPKEMSVCPIGADDKAKVRALGAGPENNQQHEEHTMAEEKNRAAGQDPQPSAAQNDNVDVAAVETAARAAGEVAEHTRVLEIIGLCDRFGVEPEQRAALIAPGVAIEIARAKVLDILAERSNINPPGFRPTIDVQVDERDKFRAAALDGLCLRAGLKVETPAAGSDELAGYTLREMARRALQIAGQPTGGSVIEMVGRAMTTSDLPNLLANVGNKSLFEGYDNAEENWREWCAVGSVPDFKTNTLAMVSETDDLDQIVNDGPYKYGERVDAKETFSLATYGKLFAITRTTIINDDLGGMTDMLMAMGEAAARKVGSLPYSVLTTNGNMRDSVALFHANHGNLGTSGVISETTVGEAIKLAKKQKGLKAAQILNIRLQYFIAPAAIEGASEIFFNSGQFSGSGVTSTRTNPYAGTRFTRIYDARLDDSSATAYYFAGAKGKTIKVFFLGGNQAPYLETRQGWTVDGVEYKVRIDAAAKALDWKAMVKNAGA